MASLKKNLIVTLADSNFIDQVKQLFSSVYFNAGWEGDYLLLACGLSEGDKLWFENKGIIVYSQPFLSDSLLGLKSYPPIVLSKFYLFKEYFKQWQKIIFLDADIIVSASLDNLLKRGGFNAPRAITIRLKDEFVSDRTKNKVVREKYNLQRLAFNTGVLVFDSEIIKSNTYEEIISLYNEFKDVYQFQEESALNLYFYNRWRLLPMIYNSSPWYFDTVYKITSDNLLACVIHFLCGLKPWDKKSPYYTEWSLNLKKAAEINLLQRPMAKKISLSRLYKYLLYLKIRKFYIFIRKFFNFCFLFIDKQVGRIGLLIKKERPDLFSRLIKYKKSFKNKN